MSGEKNLTIKERMKLVEKALEDYEGKCGLPTFNNPCDDIEIELYFNMTRDQIEKLSSQDCSEIAYRLSLISFHLQRCLNREDARIAWAQSNLHKVAATHIDLYNKYTKYEIAIALVRQQDSYAEGLGKIATYAEQRKKSLAFLAASVKNLSDVMLANYRSKQSVNRN